jgi:SpoVK/Ycf46/Vps4 family AAA+-type ATPase
MEIQNTAAEMRTSFQAQAGQVLSMASAHRHSPDETPFENNYEYLDALEKEAMLMAALAALRRGKTDWETKNNEEASLYSSLGLSAADFTIENIESLLAKKQQTNEARQKASLLAGIKLFFPLFCQEHNLNEFDRQILLLLFMNATSLNFRKMFSVCQYEEDKKGIIINVILSILCCDYREKLEHRSNFSRSSPLISRRIIFFSNPEDDKIFHIIDQTVYMNERHVRYIVGDNNLYNSTHKEITIEQSSIKLENVIIPANVKNQLVEQVDKYFRQRKNGHLSRLDEFLEYGTALTMFFHGPSGTGKTMMAKALAHHFNRHLITVKLDDINSFWRLEYLMIQAFREADLHQGFVFFDECDDIFKEGSYLARMLLIQIEKARCAVIFATNMVSHIDPALERRLAMKIYFPLPDADQRLKIWHAHLPEFIRLAPDVDLPSLNSRYPFSGGIIKNVIFLAANAAESDADGNYIITSELLENAADMQAQELMKSSKFSKTYRPLQKIDSLPLGASQHSILKNTAEAISYLWDKNKGMNAFFSGAHTETCIDAVNAVAAQCGFNVKLFKYRDFYPGQNNEIRDSVSHEKIRLIDYAFRESTEEAHIILIVDYDGNIDCQCTGGDDSESGKTFKMLLEKMRENERFCFLVCHEKQVKYVPLEFHSHLKLTYPPEEMQIEHWENTLESISINDRDIVELVERYPMHIAEIDCIMHRASIQSLIEGKTHQTSLETVKAVIERYRGKNNISLLFGMK